MRRDVAFRCVAIDPPWAERGGGRIKRGADRHYRVMGKERIRDTILRSGVWRIAKHAHLYCWVTNNKLPDGLWLVSELGFRYVTNIAWHKTRMGLGQYFRGQHELLLFAVRGKGMHPSVMNGSRSLPSSVVADHVMDERGRRVHSAKPQVFRELMEARSAGPRLEMFARSAPPGWSVWGDEAPRSR